MKLIKINTEHYVVVDETIQPVNDYYYDSFINKIKNTNGADYEEASHCWQITHSTKGKYKQEYISLQEVKELVGEVDVEKKAEQEYREFPNNPKEHPDWHYSRDINCHRKRKAFIKGYNQALEDNKEKKYTEEDIRKAYDEGYSIRDAHGDRSDNMTSDEYVKSLQPKTEWEVEIVDGKLKLI